MRKLLKRIYLQTEWGKNILNPLLRLRNIVVPQKLLLKIRFKRVLGYSLDLKNPKTFNEKINWLKLYERTPLHTICADKFEVRNHIKNTIGDQYLIPLAFVTKESSEIVPENLPDFPFIIKTNHDSGGVIVVWEKAKINWLNVRKNLKNRLKSNYSVFGKGEWQYNKIIPRIIVEKLLFEEVHKIPSDYKLHCFNGKLVFTQVDIDRHEKHKRNLYDENWNLLPCRWVHENGKHIEKPLKYEEMKSLAEKLAHDFTYVRVDLYIVSNMIFFGEMTFHSGSGNEQFIPKLWDKKFGELLKLPLKGVS